MRELAMVKFQTSRVTFYKILISAYTLSDNEKLSFVDWFREMCSYQFVVLLIGCRTLRIS
ncbi:hypothetical protein Syun_006909 [Stephania yunnanensis]|uniref:Uncharacterized protein n=1 Tax=Stephania yunnanensis TaxID=152371 RepID=A0AAP0PY38_9MAGN